MSQTDKLIKTNLSAHNKNKAFLNTKMVNKFSHRETYQETVSSLLHNVQILVHFFGRYCQRMNKHSQTIAVHTYI